MKPRPSPDQQQLPFDAAYRERFALVDAIDWRRSGLSRVRWRRVADLVKAIHACSSRTDGWCDAWADTLAERAHMSRPTFFRVLASARELGLVEVVGTYTHGRGPGKSRYRVRWENLASLGQAKPREHESQNEQRESHFEQRESQNDAPYKRNNSSSNSLCNSKVDNARETRRVETTGRRAGGGKSAAIDWDRVAGMAREVVRRISGARDRLPTSRDWELAVKASCLAASYGERWLWSAVNGARVKARSRPWGYLWTTLEDEAQRMGRQLRRDMAKITIPPWVAFAEPERIREPRMCAARDPEDEFEP